MFWIKAFNWILVFLFLLHSSVPEVLPSIDDNISWNNPLVFSLMVSWAVRITHRYHTTWPWPQNHVVGSFLSWSIRVVGVYMPFFCWYCVSITTFSAVKDLITSDRLWLRRWSGSSTNRKIGGSIPGSSSPHVDVSLGKTLNPELLLMAEPSVCEWLDFLWWAGWDLAW